MNKMGRKAGNTKQKRNLKKLYGPFFMDGVQLPQGSNHFEEAVYFLPLSNFQ